MKKQTYKASIFKKNQSIAELTVELGYLQNGDLYYMIRTEGKNKNNVPYSLSVNTPAQFERTNSIRFLNQGKKGEDWVRKAYPLNPLPRSDYFADVDGKTEGILFHGRSLSVGREDDFNIRQGIVQSAFS